MKLLKIEVASFGKLKDFSLAPQEGLNTYCYPNEFGKSTLMTFLYFIFYGYDSKWMKNYFPWDGGPLAGSLIFSLEGVRWQIFRHHPVKGAEKQQVINLDNGRELALASKEKPGPRLLGLDGETFMRTFFVRQGELLFGRTDGLDTALKNLAATGDENASFQQAQEYLQKEHSRYMYRGRNQGPLLELRTALLEQRDALFGLERQIEEKLSEKERLEQLELQREEQEKALIGLDERLLQAKRNDAARLLLQWEALKTPKSDGPVSPAEDRLLEEQKRVFEKINQAEKLRQERRDRLALTKNTLRGEEERLQVLYLPADTKERLEGFEKPNTLGILWGSLLLAAAILSGAAALIRFPLLWIAAALLLSGGLFALLYRSVAKRLYCRHCGAVGLDQLRERWGQYVAVLARVQALKEEECGAEAELQAAEEELECSRALLRELSAQTRLLNEQELERELIEREVARRTAKSLSEDQARILGGRSLEELRAEAEGGDPAGERYGAVFEEKQTLLCAREALFDEISQKDIRQLASLWEQAEDLRFSIRAQQKKEQSWSEQLAAIRRSLEWLELANEDMNRSFAPRLCNLAGEYLSLLTDGKYKEVQMDDRFEIRLSAVEGSFPVGHFSMGTKDAVYFAFRLAVGELLGEIPLPLMLDDPFVNLDQSRRESAMEMLKKVAVKRQILYFTCHS